MYEVDFLPVGQRGRHGDAIAIRFIRPSSPTYAHIIIDAGFEQDGQALVDHFDRWYETRSVDVADPYAPGRRPHRRNGDGAAGA